MYRSILGAIERNADRITKGLLEEVRMMPETWHYLNVSDEVVAERISQVIRNIHARLGSWAEKSKPGHTLFACYSGLGAERCREGLPLEEVTMVLLLIKREIWNVLSNQVAEGCRLSPDQLVEIYYHVSLFFDRIVQSTITGYQHELAIRAVMRGKEKQAGGRLS